MASAYWRTDHTVSTLFSEQEVGWEFLQLVKLLLSVEHKGTLKNDADVLNALNKHIQFKASLASDFPPGDIREIKQQGSDKPVNITLVSNMLSAVNGPLPEPFLAWMRELANAGDGAMADFLDIFNHRLMALRYLVCRTARPNLVDTNAESSETGELLQALSGVFFNRKVQPSDLRLSGLLANNRLSFPVAKKILLFEMGLTLKEMNAYQGGWLTVNSQDHSRLGKKTGVLGKNATLGKKVWDQQKAVEWVIGPLPWKKVQALIPGGIEHTKFIASLSRITDCRCDSQVVLLLPQSQVPFLRLGKKAGVNENTHEMDDAISIKPMIDSQDVSMKNKVTPALALGLSTILPTASEREKKEKWVKVCFTIETSNPKVFTQAVAS